MSVNTTPKTWGVGELLTAASMNAELRDLSAGLQATWDTYTPTWTGTSNPAIGNGVLSGRYLRVGKTMFVSILIRMGSTTTYGTGTWKLSLPVPSVWTTETNVSMGSAMLFDTSATARKTGQAFNTAQSTVQVVTDAGTLVGATVPWTWATGDVLSLNLTLEAN